MNTKLGMSKWVIFWRNQILMEWRADKLSYGNALAMLVNLGYDTKQAAHLLSNK